MSSSFQALLIAVAYALGIPVLASVGPGGTRRVSRLLAWLFPADGQSKSPVGVSRVLSACLIASGLTMIAIHAAGVASFEVTAKDFRQEYLLARAVLDHSNPYVPQALLAERYLPGSSEYVVPSMHPPAVVLLSLPFGLVSFPTAAGVWLAFEVTLLFVLAVLLTSLSGAPRFGAAGVFALVLLLWNPVMEELMWGQLGLLLSVLLVACWRCIQSGRSWPAGLLLGTAVAIKLFPAILAVFLLLRGPRRPVLIAAATFCVLTGFGMIVVGIEGMRSYVAELTSGAQYLRSEQNVSIYGAIVRTFEGGLMTAPILGPPNLGRPLATIGAAVVVLGVLAAVRSARDSELFLSAGLASIVLAGPLAWRHYEVLLIWPLVAIARSLMNAGWPKRETLALIAGVLIMGIPEVVYIQMMWLISGGATVPSTNSAGRAYPAVAMVPYLLSWVGPAAVLYAILSQARKSWTPPHSTSSAMK